MADDQTKLARCRICKKIPTAYRSDGKIYRIACGTCGCLIAAKTEGDKEYLVKQWNLKFGEK